MIENIIEQIKTSETRAKEMIQNAKKQHSEIIENAYGKSAEIETQTKADILKIFKDSEIKAVEDSKIKIGKLREEYEEKQKSILKIATEKENEAVDLVIRKVLQ